MAVVKCTYFYSQFGQGWTHSFYNTYSGGLDSFKATANDLARSLMGLVCKSTFLDYIRLSDDAVRGDSLVISPGSVQSGSGFTPVQGIMKDPPAEANTCIEVRCNAGTLNRKALFISGIQVAEADAADPFIPSPAFLNAVNDLGRTLVSASWSFKARDTSAVKNNIQAAAPVAPPGPAQWLLQFNGNPGLTIGQQVIITGVRPVGIGLTGKYFVASITSSGGIWTVGINGGSPAKSLQVVYFGGGVVQSILSTLLNITSLQIRRASSRKRGRFFGQRAGRIKSKASIR